jgi:hypothetical protein
MFVLPDKLLSKKLPKQALELQAYLFTLYIAVTLDYIYVLFQWHFSHGELLRHIILLGYVGWLLAGGAIASIEAITIKNHSLPVRRIPYL